MSANTQSGHRVTAMRGRHSAMPAALSPSAATTDLSVGFGAATKYHRRTMARRPFVHPIGAGLSSRADAEAATDWCDTGPVAKGHDNPQLCALLRKLSTHQNGDDFGHLGTDLNYPHAHLRHAPPGRPFGRNQSRR